jgi:RNA polymerase sigma-70 factor (ECF subfamily)
LTLPDKYRQVIALRYFEELSIREIADILHKKEGTIKSLLSRGLEKLKKMIDDLATKD